MAVDTAVDLEDQLGEYDHLLLLSTSWLDRFVPAASLAQVDPAELPEPLREFLETQLPLWTAEGTAFPDGLTLWASRGEALPALGVQYGGEAVPVVWAQRPLILLVDAPAEVLRGESCLLPLASTGNGAFTGERALRDDLEDSALAPYLAEEPVLPLTVEG